MIAIGYMHKTQGLANMVGMDRWVLDISKISQDVLVDKLTELWNGRMAVRDQIAGTLPVLKEKANLAGKLCAEDYSLPDENKAAWLSRSVY